MIVPYYNCLLIGHKYNELQFDEQGEEIIKDYLEEYLGSHSCGKISVTCLGAKNNQLIARLKNILHMLITNLSISVYEVNSSYTLSQQVYARYESLKDITVKDGQRPKTPAVLENLTLLKKYYTTYSSEHDMKAFLKSLLIQEINHQLRCIKYRQAAQIKLIINQEIQKITGNISISNYQAENNNINNMVIILVNQKGKQTSKLQLLVRQIQTKFEVNKEINPQITELYTLQYLRNIATNQLQKMIKPYFDLKVTENSVKIGSLKDSLMLITNLRTVLREGLRLAAQEIKLNQQFLIFVSEMRIKYTNQIGKYFKGASQFQKYQQLAKLYREKNQKMLFVQKYLIGFGSYLKFKLAKQDKIRNQCKMIQSRIRGFLINKRLYSSLMNTYLQQKRCMNNKYHEFYQRIITLQNENQVEKLTKFNRFKYGFSCCLFIIDIINKTNCEQFQPSNLLRLFDKTARSKELCTKIRCRQDSIEFYTIQGRILSFGGGNQKEMQVNQSSKKLFNNYDSNKENTQSHTNSFQSIVHQFDSQIKNPSLSRQICSSRNLSTISSLKSSLIKPQQNDANYQKQKCYKVYGKNYEFKLDQKQKLYGRGNNHFGQLGLENQEINEFTIILPFQKVKLVATGDSFTIVMTAGNKLFHFGKQKGRLPSTKSPLLFTLREKFIAKQIIITFNDIYFLTTNNKVYSFQSERTVRIPKEIQLSLEHFHLVKTGGPNLQITYLVGHWVNTLDPIKRQGIEKYLTGLSSKAKNLSCESLLVEEEKQDIKSIHELSAIMEESSF